jgi:hypothetical protein
MNEKLFGILLAICLSLATFSLKFAFDANAEIQSMKGTNALQFKQINDSNELRFKQIQQSNDVQFMQIKDSLDGITNDKENDIRQDKTLSKLWKISSWSKTEINKLQFKDGDEPTSWPDLGE